MFGVELPEILVFAVISAFLVVPFWQIYTKAGYRGELALLQLVPGVNVVALFALAFGAWPTEKRRET